MFEISLIVQLWRMEYLIEICLFDNSFSMSYVFHEYEGLDFMAGAKAKKYGFKLVDHLAVDVRWVAHNDTFERIENGVRVAHSTVEAAQ